jgi:hypothetical protein
MQKAAVMAQSTPDTRDRYVDLLRVVSLGVVVVGHWLMAVVIVGHDGSITATNALAVIPTLQPLTWLLQVMPIFFFVGGFAHAAALESLGRRGGGYADFVRSRAGRLLRPTAVFVAVWLVLALAVELTGHDRGVLQLATATVAQPLWFVGVYLGVVALAPLMLRLHRRFGVAVLAALGVAAVAVDVGRFRYGIPFIAFLNVGLVWLAVHQLGFLYHDGTLQRGGRRTAVALISGGLATTIALTMFGPYPVSMVGLPGEKISNMSPPTVALLTHAVWLTGVVLLLRAPLSRWLRRARVWAGVITANGLAMTAFLWHLTAMFAATAVTVAIGLGQPAVGSTTWWLLRPMWIGVLGIFTAGLVLLFRRADRPRPTHVGAPGGSVGAAVGIAFCVFGVLGLSVVGFGGLLAGRTATLVVLPVTPLISVAALATGAALIGATKRGGTSGRRG